MKFEFFLIDFGFLYCVAKTSPLQEVSKQTNSHGSSAVAEVAVGRGHSAAVGLGRGRSVGAGGGAAGSAGSLGSSGGGRRGGTAGSGSSVVVRVEGTALVLDAGGAVALALGVANVGSVALRVGLMADKLELGRRRVSRACSEAQRYLSCSHGEQEKSSKKERLAQWGKDVRWAESGCSTQGREHCRSGTDRCSSGWPVLHNVSIISLSTAQSSAHDQASGRRESK